MAGMFLQDVLRDTQQYSTRKTQIFPDVWIRMCNAVWGVWELIMVVFYPRVETQCCLLFCGREDCQYTLYVSAYGIVSSWFNFVGRLLRPRGNSLKRVEASTGYCVYVRAKCPIRDIDKELRIISCNNLKSLPSVQAMQRLTNLQTLYFWMSSPSNSTLFFNWFMYQLLVGVETLPDLLGNLRSLIELGIWNYKNLMNLPFAKAMQCVATLLSE